MIDAKKLRDDFPILFQDVNDEPFAYLDNTATTQKPEQALQALAYYYEYDNANVHRGVHALAERAIRGYEQVREKVRAFIHAKETAEVLFTRGTTTSLNRVARSFGGRYTKAGDKIVISYMEHHSNVIPWWQLAKRTGTVLKYIELAEEGFPDMEDAAKKITDKIKIVSIAHVSNVLGVINPVQELAELIHENGGVIVVDGVQSAPHMATDVQALDCDFSAFSGHKMCGPTDIGVLHGKRKWLEGMELVGFGGEMIDLVELHDSIWKKLPWKFEAGTPNIAGAITLGHTVDHLQELGMDNIHRYEEGLAAHMLPKLQVTDGLTVYGSQDPKFRIGVVASNLDGLHPHDIATALDMEGVTVRVGHHHVQLLLKYLEVLVTAHTSFYFYNMTYDADRLVEATMVTKEFFQYGII